MFELTPSLTNVFFFLQPKAVSFQCEKKAHAKKQSVVEVNKFII